MEKKLKLGAVAMRRDIRWPKGKLWKGIWRIRRGMA